MRIATMTASIAVCLSLSCQSCHRPFFNESEAALQLNHFEQQYEEICKMAGKEVWDYYTHTNQENLFEYKDQFAGFIANDTLLRLISSLKYHRQNLTNDTLIRRLALWERILNVARVDYDPPIQQLQTRIEKELADDPSDDLSQEDLEASIRQLIRLRNEKAKQLGYGNYANLVMQSSGIDTTWFEQFILELESGSASAYQDFLVARNSDTSRITYTELRPYIMQAYLINEQPFIEDTLKESCIRETLTDIGINLDDLPIQFKVTDLPPGIGGFGNCINIPGDFRAVAMKELSFHYLLHEIGHGLHWTHVDVDYPMFLIQSTSRII